MLARRARHDSSPEELRAINVVDDALAGGAVRRYQDEILVVGLEHEALNERLEHPLIRI